AQRLELTRAGAGHERALAERSHHDDPESELLGQRQELALALPLVRVVRDLDRVDPTRAHGPRQLVVRAWVVVRHPEEPDAPGVTFAFHPFEVVLPRNEVVDLEQVDPAPVEPELLLELPAALLGA